MVSPGFSPGVFSPAEMLRFASFVNLPCAFVSTELTLNPPEGIVAGEELSGFVLGDVAALCSGSSKRWFWFVLRRSHE